LRKPVLRQPEKHQLGYNSILLPQAQAVSQDVIAEATELLKLGPDSVAQLLAEGFFDAGAGEESRGIINAHFDALLKEVHVAFAYATQQYSVPAVTGLLLVGGGAEMPGMAERLGGALSRPVRVASPAGLIDVTVAPRVAGSASLTAALGLATYREASA
jgi:Tfp pilus assembly PilM family ATPase